MSDRHEITKLCEHRTRRRVAAVSGLLALFMLLISPHLPMPAMGGMNSWEMAALDPCPPSHSQHDTQLPVQDPPHNSCAVCAVVLQAAFTMAPVEMALVYSPVYLRLDLQIAAAAQTSRLAPRAFSSRAPPPIA